MSASPYAELIQSGLGDPEPAADSQRERRPARA